MDLDSTVARLPLRVFALLFVAYVVTHVVLLRFVYDVAPTTSFLLAEPVAIAGGAMAARVTLVVWRHAAGAAKPHARGAAGRT